jgi:hypothetical protein
MMALRRDLTVSIGSVHYMSPEVVCNSPLVYGLEVRFAVVKTGSNLMCLGGHLECGMYGA